MAILISYVQFTVMHVCVCTIVSPAFPLLFFLLLVQMMNGYSSCLQTTSQKQLELHLSLTIV